MSERDENTPDEPGNNESEASAEDQVQDAQTEVVDAEAEVVDAEAEVVDAEAVEPEEVEDNVEVLPDESTRLRQQLDESSARLRAVSKAYKDLQTEMDAFRRRQQGLAEAKAEKRAAQVVERFFEPVQNLRRALDQQDVSAEDLRAGVQMVFKQFVGRMEELGLAEIPGVGSNFDPQVHDALAQLPVTDEAMNGKVIEVYATGWRVGDKVIQPAQVVVGVYQEPAES